MKGPKNKPKLRIIEGGKNKIDITNIDISKILQKDRFEFAKEMIKDIALNRKKNLNLLPSIIRNDVEKVLIKLRIDNEIGSFNNFEKNKNEYRDNIETIQFLIEQDLIFF